MKDEIIVFIAGLLSFGLLGLTVGEALIHYGLIR